MGILVYVFGTYSHEGLPWWSLLLLYVPAYGYYEDLHTIYASQWQNQCLGWPYHIMGSWLWKVHFLHTWFSLSKPEFNGFIEEYITNTMQNDFQCVLSQSMDSCTFATISDSVCQFGSLEHFGWSGTVVLFRLHYDHVPIPGLISTTTFYIKPT